ncbi:OLC1v1000865C1 [Oldenlandia corymbosa var. corymbosa]|uniref:OLC1v1000865C1 n=1 Tax=Oldenlandia corymbosa var. corymbosa TaxID=529605 RepID=A0AAV1D498_OLDCO|nr:OLC1v1000865C1 [Oldenlandia corymbosa var. corymbosa]
MHARPKNEIWVSNWCNPNKYISYALQLLKYSDAKEIVLKATELAVQAIPIAEILKNNVAGLQSTSTATSLVTNKQKVPEMTIVLSSLVPEVSTTYSEPTGTINAEMSPDNHSLKKTWKIKSDARDIRTSLSKVILRPSPLQNSLIPTEMVDVCTAEPQLGNTFIPHASKISVPKIFELGMINQRHTAYPCVNATKWWRGKKIFTSVRRVIFKKSGVSWLERSDKLSIIGKRSVSTSHTTKGHNISDLSQKRKAEATVEDNGLPYKRRMLTHTWAPGFMETDASISAGISNTKCTKVVFQDANVVVAQIIEAAGLVWMAIFLYGLPVFQDRTNFWTRLNGIIQGFSYPSILLGDFNQVIDQEDKYSGRPVRPQDTRNIHQFLTTNDLEELKHLGYWYTWINKRHGSDVIFERDTLLSANWIPRIPNPINAQSVLSTANLRVNRFITPSVQWRLQALRNFFPDHIISIISGIFIDPARHNQKDCLQWIHTDHGHYTVKTGYQVAINSLLPQPAPDPALAQAEKLAWKKLWHSKV